MSDNTTNPARPDKTPPLLPIHYLRQNKVVFDFETGHFLYKDQPQVIHQAKSGLQPDGTVGPKSYWLLPVTTRAASAHNPISPSDLSKRSRKTFPVVQTPSSTTSKSQPSFTQQEPSIPPPLPQDPPVVELTEEYLALNLPDLHHSDFDWSTDQEWDACYHYLMDIYHQEGMPIMTRGTAASILKQKLGCTESDVSFHSERWRRFRTANALPPNPSGSNPPYFRRSCSIS